MRQRYYALMATNNEQLQEIMDRLDRLDDCLALVPQDLLHVRHSLDQLRSEITIMRAVVTDHSYELKAYGERLRDLELGY